MVRARWQLPLGVSRESWDYIQSEKIAERYEDFLAENPLFQLDIQVVHEQLELLLRQFPRQVLYSADLGCGTARVARILDPNLFRILNIDLSLAMLRQGNELASNRKHAVGLQANLAELQFLRPKHLHFAVCLFSSLGMLRPRKLRVRFLQQVHSSLKDGGRFLVHVHNRYRSVLDPGGVSWLALGLARQWIGKGEFGDRYYPYRGLPRMFLHIYSRRELIEDLTEAGFRFIELLPIDVTGSKVLSNQTPLIDLRAGGFFGIATK